MESTVEKVCTDLKDLHVDPAPKPVAAEPAAGDQPDVPALAEVVMSHDERYRTLDLDEEFQADRPHTFRMFFGRIEYTPTPDEFPEFHQQVIQMLCTLPFEPCVVVTPMLYRLLLANTPRMGLACSHDVLRAYFAVYMVAWGSKKHNDRGRVHKRLTHTLGTINSIAKSGAGPQILAVYTMRAFEHYLWKMEAPEEEPIFCFMPPEINVRDSVLESVEKRVEEAKTTRARWYEINKLEPPKYLRLSSDEEAKELYDHYFRTSLKSI